MFKLGGIEKVLLPREAHTKMAPGWWKPWDPKRGQDQVINKWLEGRTGVPFIDANMVSVFLILSREKIYSFDDASD